MLEGLGYSRIHGCFFGHFTAFAWRKGRAAPSITLGTELERFLSWDGMQNMEKAGSFSGTTGFVLPNDRRLS